MARSISATWRPCPVTGTGAGVQLVDQGVQLRDVVDRGAGSGVEEAVVMGQLSNV